MPDVWATTSSIDDEMTINVTVMEIRLDTYICMPPSAMKTLPVEKLLLFEARK